MFDVPPTEEQELRWAGDIPLEAQEWSVGLIVGPSGSGKSTIAHELFGDRLTAQHEWSGASVLEDFPREMSIPDIAAICQAVGFNTIPAWLRPFGVLSNGEKFRVSLARALVESDELTVVDEFTSVVDRQVARIGSHAVQKYVRKSGKRFVAVSCHYDIEEWLNPDWVLEPATMTFRWRSLRPRPPIGAEICKVDRAAWRLFAPYHYMSADLSRAAQCYSLMVDGQPVSFLALLHRPVSRSESSIWGVSRAVTLPDWQGLGLTMVLANTIGSALASCGRLLHHYPAHPSFIRSLARSREWQLRKRPGRFSSINRSGTTGTGAMGGRPCAVFRYIGPADPNLQSARQLLAIPSLLSAR